MIYKRFCGSNTRSFLIMDTMWVTLISRQVMFATLIVAIFFCIAKLACHENFKLKGNWAEPAFDMQTQPDFESESMRELPLTQQYY